MSRPLLTRDVDRDVDVAAGTAWAMSPTAAKATGDGVRSSPICVRDPTTMRFDCQRNDVCVFKEEAGFCAHAQTGPNWRQQQQQQQCDPPPPAGTAGEEPRRAEGTVRRQPPRQQQQQQQ
eukprot:GHVU01041638.1.p2 GENE.GHVU01041638.1~~GHVU01041638.1.p2  ORF type:complete len:120 (+),score=23.13 GHVU01041638.1:300-659(+)